jgi:hypothetical protein
MYFESADVFFYSPGTYTINVTYTNSCGTSSGSIVEAWRGGSAPSFVYPNPADDILYVDLDQIANPVSHNVASFDLRLYDGLGNMLQQKKAKNGIVRFDVSALSDGMYYLHIHDGVSATPDVHKVIVKH